LNAGYGRSALTASPLSVPAQDDIKKKLDGPGFDAGAFEALESNFQEVRALGSAQPNCSGHGRHSGGSQRHTPSPHRVACLALPLG